MEKGGAGSTSKVGEIAPRSVYLIRGFSFFDAGNYPFSLWKRKWTRREKMRKEEQERSSLNLMLHGFAYDALDVFITFNRSQSCLSYTYRILHLLKLNA
jgi:hypothetical protein